MIMRVYRSPKPIFFHRFACIAVIIIISFSLKYIKNLPTFMRKYNSCTAAGFTYYTPLCFCSTSPFLPLCVLVKIPCLTSHQSHKTLIIRIKLINIISQTWKHVHSLTQFYFHSQNSIFALIVPLSLLQTLPSFILTTPTRTRGQSVQSMYCQVAP